MKTDSKNTKPVSKEEILTAIRAEAKQTRGGRIRLKRFLAKTKIEAGDLYRHFVSWGSAVSAARIDWSRQRGYVESDELLKDWGTVVRELKRPPTFSSYDEHGKYSPATMQHRFGSWLNVRQSFILFSEGKEEWADVLQFCSPPLPRRRKRREDELNGTQLPRRTRRMHALARPRGDRPTFGEPVDDVPGCSMRR
jgi:hypothetical protein